MKKAKNGQQIDTIFVLMIFCVFAVLVLMVLTTSGGIYQNMNDISHDGYNEKTCLSYVWSKVKTEDTAGKFSVGDFHGIPALCLKEVYDGSLYHTYIYLYDGWVREMFFEADLDFAPEDGTPVIETDTFMVEQRDHGLIEVTTDAGHLLIYPRGQNIVTGGSVF